MATVETLNSKALEEKLDRIVSEGSLQTVLIGGFYLDLLVRPVGTTLLKAEEWSDADPIEIQLGGSCYWLGKNLHELHGQSSFVYTMLGRSDDALTADAARLVKQEGWILNALPQGSISSRTAISVNLVQRSNRFSTILTYRGTLAELSWRNIKDDLVVTLKKRSVVHISGFFKTNLSSGMIAFLRPIHNRHVICFDHGGFVSQVESPPAVLAIREAYEQSIVDIYLCTLEEFQKFCEFSAAPVKKRRGGSPESVIKELASGQCLPCLTIVRGEDLPDREKVYIILKGRVITVKLKDGLAITKGLVFSKVKFDAAFLYSLTHNYFGESLESRATSAAHEGLMSWARSSDQ
ncbi:hypothetical protein F6X54_30995 [Micromonospora aurantiaca]|uniref:Cyclic nucleotide-binding domain-containing protein n=1 Tax=Micromonospora aurantiaca (nom. illeg.) TaxID=47850 RepID=A0ABQ6U828_9ACTN|nr:hypothetical protein [Micromonospora aurantiaca]KAB1102703.1 hypothetical protein F6X54_30995 [Micromonospora aurantiaca]